jgi:hypothetical protein
MASILEAESLATERGKWAAVGQQHTVSNGKIKMAEQGRTA